MVEHQFRIADIEVAKSPTDEKIVGLFRYEGSGQQKKGTSLVIVAEIQSTLYAYERLLDIINSTAEQAKHLVAAVEQDPVARFEKLIQRLNDAVATFLEGEPTPLAWGRVNIFIIELSQDHICLTGRGRLMNLFLQKQPDGSYKMFDLFGSLEQPAEVDPKKPFASLICGDVKPGDVLMTGTLNFERLRNELRVKERLTTLPPVSAALEIKRDLESRGIPDDYVAAVIACCALEMPSGIATKIAEIETDKSTASMSKLRETEKEAMQQLSPTIAPNKPSATTTAPGKKPFVAGFLGLLQSVRHRVRAFQPKDVAMMASLRGMNAGHGSLFTKKRKQTAIIAGAVLILLLVGLGLYRRSQHLAAEAAAWQATFDKAQDNKNRADSDLVYGNDARAQKEIETALGLLATLDVTKKEHKDTVDRLTKEIGDVRERLRKIVPANPILLTELSGAANGSLTAPVLVKDKAYAVDNSSHTVLKVDVGDKSIKRITLPASADQVVSGSKGKQSVVFMTATGRMYAVDTQTDAVVALGFQPKASSTTDIVLYANRAYILDGPNGQVYRASSIATGFGNPENYIKASNIALNGAVALAVDSNVYVLKPDGTLARFLSGGQEGFNLNAIDPPLRAASGLWTNADATRIAITDPAGKRVLVFNKDGSLKAQLTSDQFTGPRDVDGDEANKRLLVIDGTKLDLVALP